MLDAGQAGRRELPISESETCHCWADAVAQHLTSSTAKQITAPVGERCTRSEDNVFPYL